MSMLKIGVAGLGTVGMGLLKLAFGQGPLASVVQVVGVSARTLGRVRDVDITHLTWFDDPVELAKSPNIDVFVELIGGADGSAKDAVEAALMAGKHVVTANKALLAAHGAHLATLAAKHGSEIRYEAAVAGGIPVIKALREGLAANYITSVSGVLNGTCNFILTEMDESGRSFAEVLAEAQRLGYAEADPSLDVSGADAGHKLSILSAIAFGGPPDFSSLRLEGIEAIEPIDLESAKFLGRRVKLLAKAARVGSFIVQSVRPTLLGQDHPIARVNGALNAVVIDADPVGRLSLVGAGAGAGPTASAVAGDLIDLSHQDTRPVFSGPGQANSRFLPNQQGSAISKFYVRLRVADRAGTIAKITDTLAKHLVSIESFLQKPPEDAARVPIVLTTQPMAEGDLFKAMAELSRLEIMVEPPILMPLED
ncbi:homoserine dehydrogenase [Candidatus Phycosocius spiralis]|uniref:Homoserine dehydrogenase n=1 Tax=Candidatus Phycosocius spiralis TaxID=2815099 RepID=A0ABQ4PSH3_9PROT|nr:homoserine dehydrogenase [Candidatus Phycosocius spiralis]GIU65874.1 homoserine dehydrogenase [Candidatus Phycosocius spiralis]